jgi:hypothetical protein
MTPRRYEKQERTSLFRRPRCGWCDSLDVRKRAGISSGGYLYIECVECGKNSRCIEAECVEPDDE